MKKLKLYISALSFILIGNTLGSCSSSTGFQKPVDNPILKADTINQDKKGDSSNKDYDFEIKMLDLGCRWGDSTLIRYEDKHILIDAGGTESIGTKEKPGPAQIIYDALKKDKVKKLDYLIFTHADKDHIVNFSNKNGGVRKWIEEDASHYIDTFIDFDMDGKTDLYKKIVNDESVDPLLLSEYRIYRKKLINNKKIKHYNTALQCINHTNNGKEFYPFKKGSNDGIRILNNYFYGQTGEGISKGALRNVLSVSCLITVNGHNHLFTGDLEEFDSGFRYEENSQGYKPYKRIYGESFLAALNYEYLKDGVDFFKAGHHGSYTSNSANLLDLIRPKYIGIPTCVYETLNDFPATISIRNMIKWTDYIYPYGVVHKDGKGKNVFDTLYGDVILRYNKSNDETIFTSSELLKGKNLDVNGALGDWCLQNKRIDANIYTLGDIDEDGYGIFNSYEDINLPVKSGYKACVEAIKEHHSSMLEEKYVSKTISNATYIKFGHIDILINLGQSSGSYGNSVIYNNIDKINKLCNDHVLEYLILSNNNYESLICLTGHSNTTGLIHNTNIKKVENFFHFGFNNENVNEELKEKINSIIESDLFNGSKLTNIETSDSLNNKKISILERRNGFEFFIQFLNMKYTDSNPAPKELDVRNNLMFIVQMTYKQRTMKYLNLGKVTSTSQFTEIFQDNEELLYNIDVLDLMSHGYYIPSEENNIDSSTLSEESNEIPQSTIDIHQFFKYLGEQMNYPKLLFNGSYRYDDSRDVYPTKESLQNTKNDIYSTAIYDSSREEFKNHILAGNIICRFTFGAIKETIVEKYLIYGSQNVDYYTASVKNQKSLQKL